MEVSDWSAVREAMPAVIWLHCLTEAVLLKPSSCLHIVNTTVRWSPHHHTAQRSFTVPTVGVQADHLAGKPGNVS